MKRYRKIFSLLLAAALALSLVPSGAPGQMGSRADAADDGFQNLNQAEIVDAMGAGWNLGNQLEANSDGTPVEDAWSHVKITERMIRTVKNNGFQSIRIPVSYLSKIGPAPNYTINKLWLDRIQEVVDWAIKYKLYVIINIHGDGYSSVTGGWILPGSKGNQDTIQAKYEAVWKQIAERFKDYDQHLIYESMNEVGADISEMKEGDEKAAAITAAYENINAYNQIFVDTVRQSGGNNDRRWLLVPGLNTDVDYTAGDYGFKIPEDTYRSKEIPESEKRLMVSVHYYAPWAFCGQEVQPSPTRVLLGVVKYDSVVNTPLVDVTNVSLPDTAVAIKRAFDIVASALGLIITLPVMCVVGAAVKLSSPGPVFYRQERLGLNRKPFKLYKFRTMIADSEPAGPQLTATNDSRITAAGRVLRRYRLDELPNLWNVFKGDMSLVGPRPERSYYASRLIDIAPHYLLVHRVRPGVTSWGMVKYGYASTLDQMVERLTYDILYLQNLSLSLDIKILFYTVRTILRGEGK